MAGKVNVPITVAVQGLANTQKQLNTLKGSIGGVGAGAAVAAASFAAFAIGIKSADFFSSAIAGARDLERNLAGVKSVFESLAPDMVNFSKNAYSMGLGMTEAAKATTFIGSVLKQSGFSIKETADLTERLVGLGTDLSITYGYDVQEALMGMTALFRGEYDPIEKFGVAMKQSEVNAAVAAKGLGTLTLAQQRLVEQQVRVDLLFERSTDALGAFERQSGTVAVEQLKLAATFANVRDTVAVGLLPAIGSLLAEVDKIIFAMGPELQSKLNQFGPKLERLVDNLVPVMEALADAVLNSLDLIADLFDFLEDNGTILVTLAAGAFGASTAFGIMTGAISAATGAMTAFTAAVIANPYAAVIAGFIGLSAAAFVATSQIDMHTEPVFVDLTNRTSELGSAVDRMQPSFQMLKGQAEQATRYLGFLRGRVLELNKEFTNTNTIAGILKASGLTMEDLIPSTDEEGTTTATEPAKNYVKEFFTAMREEIEKQKARIRLDRLGLSEGLIDSILGSEGWQKVFNRVIASGSAGLKKLQADFNRTKAGINELEKKRKEAYDDAAASIKVLQDEADRLQEAFENATQAADDFKESMRQIATIDILPTLEEELGRFEDQIVSTFRNIREELSAGLGAGTILIGDFNTLTAWVKAEEIALRTVSKQRDELANRYNLAEALISEYRDAFTSGMSLISMLNRVESQTEKRIVTETSQGIIKLGRNLREFGITVTRSFEETVENVVSKSDSVLTGFRDMAVRARAFADNLNKLRQLGLDPKLFAQLVQAGVEAGGETAQALIEGGSATITEINSLFNEIDNLGRGLGEEVAASLYGSGIDMANGLLEGIRSKQTELENLARSMAEAFNKQFQASVAVAVAIPVAAAESAANVAQVAVPEIQSVNLDNLSKINELIARATAWLGQTTSAFEQIRTEDILEVYRGLRDDILAGRDIDLSGISRGMTPDQAAAAARAAGGTVNNYSFSINTSPTSSAQQIAQSAVTLINRAATTGVGVKTTLGAL